MKTMLDLEQRRQDRALRKLRNAGVPEAELPTGADAVAAAEAADRAGDPYALGGIGRADPTAVLVKG
jgi:hypothetical protein